MEDLKKTVARNLQELRREAGLTQAEVAEKLNYSDKAVSKWENGESLADVQVLSSLAGLYGVTLDYLVTAEHPKKTENISSRRRSVRRLITALSVLAVWTLALGAFVFCDIAGLEQPYWLAFVAAVPLSFAVLTVFDSVWFGGKRFFLYLSVILWTVILSVYLVSLLFGRGSWQLFLIGVPLQAALLLWSGLRRRKPPKKQ